MDLEIIPRSQQITTSWSGGTTTQLYIYPENASYQERNFLFRISTARVEVEESVFTKLPGISRQIMILEGTLKLEHTGRYTKILHKFETDSFEGDWETKGFGKVIDFNLMTSGDAPCVITGIFLTVGKTLEFRPDNSNQFIGFYLYRGKLAITSIEENCIIEKKDFIMALPDDSDGNIHITALEDSEFTIARIY